MRACGHPDDRDRWGNCRGCNADAARRYRKTENGIAVGLAYEATPDRRSAAAARTADHKRTPAELAAHARNQQAYRDRKRAAA